MMTYTSTDYVVYSMGTLDLETGELSDGLATLPGDSTVKTLSDGRTYNLNRYGIDVLRVYETGSWDAPVIEVSVGDGTANPHDVVLCDGELYVGLYGGGLITVLNPDTGSIAGAVDLSEYADSDGVAEVEDLFCHEGTVFAVSQQIESTTTWASAGGVILAIDTATKAVTSSYEVSLNPKAFSHPTNGDELVLLSGNYGYGDGAITTFNMATGEESDDLALESDFGITFDGFAASDTHAVIIGSPADYSSTRVLCADLETWAVTEGPTIDGYTNVLAGDSTGTAWIGIPNKYSAEGEVLQANGLQAFDINSCSIEGDLIETLLQPYSITFY